MALLPILTAPDPRRAPVAIGPERPRHVVRRERRAEDGRILDREGGALGEERQHRVAGVANERDPPARQGLYRAVVQGPNRKSVV